MSVHVLNTPLLIMCLVVLCLLPSIPFLLPFLLCIVYPQQCFCSIISTLVEGGMRGLEKNSTWNHMGVWTCTKLDLLLKDIPRLMRWLPRNIFSHCEDELHSCTFIFGCQSGLAVTIVWCDECIPPWWSWRRSIHESATWLLNCIRQGQGLHIEERSLRLETVT